MTYETILYEKSEHVAKIAFNLPDRRNVMTSKLLEEFNLAVQDVKKDRDVRVLIITGSGKAFCAGADLSALTELARSSGLSGISGTREALRSIYDAFLQSLHLEIPTIAAVNGYAIGGGLGLALCCDIRIAADSAKFAANFASIGIHPGMAITYMLPRLVGRGKACEMLFTGRMVDAQEAERIGLVEKVVPYDTLQREAQQMAETIALSAPYIVKLSKKAVYNGLGFNPAMSIESEATAQALCSQMEDATEGIKAFFEKRKPQFKGI